MTNPRFVNGHVRTDSVASDATTMASPTPHASTIFKSPAPERTVNGPVPPEHPFRTLVLCFDGTGDQFDADNSNIVELFTILKKDDRSKQMVYYQSGIGTYTSAQIVTPITAKLSKVLDQAIAWNLDAHVIDGYEFLMQNYTAGDRICMFGFSRGAYTARALAGMIHKVGLLPPCNQQQLPFAYKMFTTEDEDGWKQANGFKKAFSIDVDIEFIGVWDTVDSVGLIPKELPFTKDNTIVCTFRHAISLDEHRAKFKANHWHRPTAEDEKHANHAISSTPHHEVHCQTALERKYAKDRNAETDVDEVWFAGCHCDVGGGSVSNEITTNLARIPLRWMIRECFRTNTGIMFHSEGLLSLGLEPNTLYPNVLPRPPALSLPPTARIQNKPVPPQTNESKALDNTETVPRKTEEELELADALSPIYDQLDAPWIGWFWWFLECLPLKQRYQKENDDTWVTRYMRNRSRGRFTPKQTRIRVHRSVYLRKRALDMNGNKYVPKAEFDEAIADWVE